MGIKCSKCQYENPDDTLYCGKCGTSLQPEKEIPFSRTRTIQQPPKIIAEGYMLAGKYRIVEPIGKGGMGVVYKAEDTKLKRTVAVKFLPSELSDDSEAGERFLREAQAAAALSHPHICTIHEINEEETQPFIVMEYVEGQSLNQKIKQGPLEQAEALDIAIQVAEGLEEAHKKGIIHRDIKPGNIMLTTKGQAKVMDFGLAKVLGESLITKEARTMGTVAYMSPEQAKGEVLDSKTDIWSLGVVLYEMLTGKFPFKGEYDQSIIHSILSREPEPLTKVCSNLPNDLENVVFTALAKNPADRYQDMDEFLKDLKAIAQELKPLGAKVGLLRKRTFGIKKVYAFAGLATLILLIALAVIFLILRGVQTYDSIAILPLINDSGDPDQDYVANSLTELLINELYKVAALNVASRQSVMPYKDSNKSPREIADELRVKAIVEASVLTSGNKVRLTARLWDPYQQKIIWADTLEKEYSEIMILQSELAQDIVSGIRVAVTPAEKARLVTEREVVRQAYDTYLKGVDWWNASAGQADVSNEERLRRSLDWFQKAIDIDPTLAEAHALKAHVLVQLSFLGLADQRQTMARAKEAAQEAMKINPDLPMARRSLGIVKSTEDWDFLGAEHELKLAYEIEPGNELTKICYLETLAHIGKGDEAITLLNRWIDEHKKNDSARAHDSENTLLLMLAGRFKEALEEQKIVIDSLPNPSWLDVIWLAIAYAANDLNADALAEIEKVKDLPGPQEDIKFQLWYGVILGRNGRREDALDILKKVRLLQAKSNADDSFASARFYAGIGDNDKALEYLWKAYENHSAEIIFLISDWALRSLHGDPRFEELRKKVGFPEVQVPAKKQ